MNFAFVNSIPCPTSDYALRIPNTQSSRPQQSSFLTRQLCNPTKLHNARVPISQLFSGVQKQSSAVSMSAADGEVLDALVVGSGVSGSSLAFSLFQKGTDNILLTEARDVVGGNLISRQENGYTWEEGPNTFQPSPQILRLAVDLGLKDELVFADHTLPRFVYWDEKLFALPMGPQDIPKFKLLSPWGFIRAGFGAVGFVLPNTKGRDESVKDFITRHLGKEVFEKMIDPFVSGVYAGDPKKLAMAAAFKKIKALEELGNTLSIIEGAIIRIKQRKKEAPPKDPELPDYKGGSLGSFKNGLQTLSKTVQTRLGPSRVKLNWKLVDLERNQETGIYTATYETPQGTKMVQAKTVTLTTPAYATSNILKNLIPISEKLKDIHYPCVYSVTLAYPKSEFKTPLRGFGNLIPRSMGIRTLGTIWSSVLFPGRAPDGMELLLSYIGGAQDPTIKDLSDEQVVAQVDADIKKILLKPGSTVAPKVVGVRKWPQAIPQYNAGYLDLMDEVNKGVANFDGLYLGGNYAAGIAFGDCVVFGVDTAPKIREYLSVASSVKGAEERQAVGSA